MAYRKYDTCFFERYAILVLKTVLGHKFDDLVNEDRPDLQSSDRHRLGIEVTRAMEGGKAAAQQMLKDLAGISASHAEADGLMSEILGNGYGFGLTDGRYVGGLELDYWKLALPMKEVIASKVGKVTSGFYGDFSEFGLFVFSKDYLDEWEAVKTMNYAIGLQAGNEVKYARLFLHCPERLYACNLEDGISHEYRLTAHDIAPELRRKFYLESLNYEG